MTKTVTFELLGPVDLGRDEDWWHIGIGLDMRSLCGHIAKEILPDDCPGRCCPDCVRIARSRGLL